MFTVHFLPVTHLYIQVLLLFIFLRLFPVDLLALTFSNHSVLSCDLTLLSFKWLSRRATVREWT